MAAAILGGIAAWTDARQGIIPNKLTFSVLAIAPVMHFLLGGTRALAHCGIGFLVLGLPAAALFYLSQGKFRGGDVKFLAALGALLGAEDGLHAEILGTLLALLYGGFRKWRAPSGTIIWIRLGPWFFLGILAAFSLRWWAIV